LNLLAKAEYTEVLNQSRDPVLRFRASLGLAKVFVAQGKLDEALALLDQLPQAPNGSDLAESLLIRADIELLRTKYDAADEILRELPILSGALDLQRKRLQARSLMMQEKYHEGISLLKGDNEIGDLPAVFQLDVAEFFYQSGQISDALLIWKRLAEGEFALMPTQQALLQLARHALETENIPQARIYLQTLSSGKGLHASLEPEVYPVFIRLLEKEGAYLEAAAYLSAFEKLIKDPIENTRLKALRAQNLIRGGELETARNELQQLIATRGDQVEIARVQLFLIRTNMDLEAFDDVKDACKTYLSVFTDPEGLREAETALASAHEQLSEYRKAELLYEKVYKDAPVDSELRLAMLVKSGDMALAQRNFPVAVERYRLFLDSYPEHARVPQVLIQMSAAIAESGSLNEALNVLRRVRLRYPESPFAEKALIQQAILLQKSQRPEQALGVYDSYLELYPEGDFVADAMTDKGITAYRLGLFDLALRQFKEVSERFPEHPRVEQAQSLTGWTHYLMGEDEAARRVGREFLKKYPKSPYANEVRFWLAEVAFNRGEYPLAAESFQILTSADNPNPLRAKAHYLAGRALMADKKPEQALTEFSAARELDPAAPFAADVLFYMGDVLTEQGRFDEAILVFDQLIRLHPDSYLVYAARGRMGDCQYTLGERDSSRYLEALNSYKLVEESKEAGMELRLQAMYKVGRTLNALDRAEEARRQLEKMIQQYMLHRNVVGSDAATWFLRAVMDVAQSYEQSAEYRNAIKIYEKLRDSGLPQADEGARRIEALRREQRILF
ncbi:MAG: tetratricopeptide repeat protein, partial [Kiritimatiellia bacterium]